MHITKDMQTAIQYAKKGSNVMATDIEAKGGYPVINGEEIIVYGAENMKLDANGGRIPVISVLAELYKQCAGE